jgi:hypothetical protein
VIFYVEFLDQIKAGGIRPRLRSIFLIHTILTGLIDTGREKSPEPKKTIINRCTLIDHDHQFNHQKTIKLTSIKPVVNHKKNHWPKTGREGGGVSPAQRF